MADEELHARESKQLSLGRGYGIEACEERHFEPIRAGGGRCTSGERMQLGLLEMKARQVSYRGAITASINLRRAIRTMEPRRRGRTVAVPRLYIECVTGVEAVAPFADSVEGGIGLVTYDAGAMVPRRQAPPAQSCNGVVPGPNRTPPRGIRRGRQSLVAGRW